jgi:hypothetical protein
VIGEAIARCYEWKRAGREPEECTNMYQGQQMLNTRKNKGITMEGRELEEEMDPVTTRMGTVEILEAQEVMERRVSERSNPTAFLA